MYEKFFKHPLDFVLALISFILLFPLLLVLTVLGAIKMKGNPFFAQPRPGKNERIFKLIKFRTMTYEKDEYGRLLPDEKRLTQYGKFLRSTSLDELPELINIIRGDMSVVGPRPQLVCDMVFMTEQQRMRHIVRPGLTGLAQVNGRNNISWEDKFENDLQYIRQITFIGDMKIIFKTIEIVFKRSNIVRTGTASDINLGDWLLQNGIIEQGEYEEKHNEAKELMKV